MEDAKQGPWIFKNVEGEGIFVKVNDTRVKTRAGHLAEKVLTVQACNGRKAENRNCVLVSRSTNLLACWL